MARMFRVITGRAVPAVVWRIQPMPSRIHSPVGISPGHLTPTSGAGVRLPCDFLAPEPPQRVDVSGCCERTGRLERDRSDSGQHARFARSTALGAGAMRGEDAADLLRVRSGDRPVGQSVARPAEHGA